MAEKGRELLRTVYRVPAGQDRGHPARHSRTSHSSSPTRPRQSSASADKPVILTFGLLSPNKGIEVMIDAMPAILKRRPDAVYVVLGATHPNLVRAAGRGLSRKPGGARARSSASRITSCSSTSSSIRPTLLDFISMCDVYVTPYLNEAQMTSGTLAYSFGLGKAVVSTPYWHAQELLADGRGILVPFGDAAAHRRRDRRTADRRRPAAGHARARLCRQPVDDLGSAPPSATSPYSRRRARRIGISVIARPDASAPVRDSARAAGRADSTISCRCATTPGCSSMRSIRVPDRAHGYCVDDNARALLLACALNARGEQRLPEVADRAACRLRPARLEPRHAALSQFHGLRPALARGQRLGGQPRAHAVGAGRVRARATPVRRGGAGPPACSPRRCRRWRLSARHAPGPSRCSGWTPIAPSARTTSDAEHAASLLADRLMALLAAVETQRLGVVRGRPWPMTTRVCHRP